MSVRKRGEHWHVDFQIKGVRYRRAVPEARTKREAQQAEDVIKRRVFEAKYGTGQPIATDSQRGLGKIRAGE